MAVRMRHHLGAAMPELRWEPTPTRVRAMVGEEVVVDSDAALLVWEPRRLVPVYAVPMADLAHGATPSSPQPDPPDLATLPPLMGPVGFTHTCPGTALDLATGSGTLLGAGFQPDDPDLQGAVILDFNAFDSWLAEDEPRVAHPHDPFKRISVHASSRRIEVSLDGTVLASTDRALMLAETHLPVRWYLPPDDVRTELLVPSDKTSSCAYKGHASYFSLATGQAAIAWTYRAPLDDALRVKDHLCFWSERTDLVVDGVAQDRPITPWSTPEEQRGAAADRLEFG
jgi:uncharacterized protein (DUF427 family)